jgi:hypothetical protein
LPLKLELNTNEGDFMKKEQITNLWVQGLLMAAVVGTAVAMVDPAWAQLSSTATNSKGSIFQPLVSIVSYLSYMVAMVLGIGGIVKLHSHSVNPTSTPMSHGIARLAGGAALAAMPSLAGMLQASGSSTLAGTATFNSVGW